MYRARVDDVAGASVYADGKWLRCIGNKNVSVGDYVWTDGRCVYGHLQESEQPKVITAPEDEGIPILIYKRWSEGEYQVGDRFCYTYDTRLKELKQPESLAAGSELINDYKRTAYCVNYGNEATTFFAVNIDKHGNKYKLIGTQTKIRIYKNGEEVSTTDLTPLIGQQRAEAVSSVPSGGIPNSPIASGYSVHGKFAVIENENDWNALLFIYTYGRQSIISEETATTHWGVHGTNTYHAEGSADYCSVAAYLVNQTGYTQISSCQGSSWELWRKEIPVIENEQIVDYIILGGQHSYSASISPPNKDVKFQLQDGFYFTIDEYPNFPDNLFGYPLFMKISIYTEDAKTDKPVLTETFPTRSRITIAKTKSRYLIAVRTFADFYAYVLDANSGYRELGGIVFADIDDTVLDGRYVAYRNETPYVDNGLYLYDGKTLEKISDGTCYNARFRPMKKIRGWQKRVQKFDETA